MNQRFEFTSTSVKDLVVCRRKPINHDLGSFVRTFCNEEFKRAGFDKPIAQINQTLTRTKGAVRGLHFQYPPHSEMKITTCLKGSVFDVAVDIRRGSPTFLKWHGEVLSEDNDMSMVIPEGFAHGFQALTTECEMLYFHTAPYAAEAEGGLRATDPAIGIEWPLDITEMSTRDTALMFADARFEGVET
jgi:dTDP-4-dehydrorhamnose 3,5-epimerase